jgi:hypothetical protein
MILLSLVGEQPIPNLLPLWQSTEYSATRFAATRTTLPVAEALMAAIRIDPQLQQLKVLDTLLLEAYDIQQARTQLASALAEYQVQSLPVCVNLTGGTKLMSLAALQAAFGTGVPLLYVTTEQNEIIHYRSDGSETGREPIKVCAGVYQYLRAHGLEASDNQNFDPNGPRSNIRPAKEGDALEEEVYRRALDSGLFDDVRRSVHIRKQSRRGPVVNELDVVVTRNGRMAVCSCKAGRQVTKENLYELASLSQREVAGIYCGKVMASALSELPTAIRDRAEANRIHLVYGSEIANIADHLVLATR